MVFLRWDAKIYGVKVDEIDKQHEKLFDLINRCFAASKEAVDKTRNLQLVDELIAYTLTHFSDEEKYMTSIGYPGLMEHQFQHKGICKRVAELKESVELKKGLIDTELMTFLKSLVKNHILGHDAKYAIYGAKKRAA